MIVMKISKKFRGCDKFGAQVHLNYKGQTESGTVGGGIATVCLSTLILAYFCIRMLDVTTFADPVISSYTIMEDRNKMEAPINLQDFNLAIWFGFISKLTL